jgi:predicted ribosomally synthesized peptide with SipW-like signal peptide
MTQDTQPKLYDLSRRQVLGGLGAVGLASAGAGLGTSAFFRDDESVSAALTAGRLDLLIDYRATYNTWLGQEETDAIVNGTAIAAPGEGEEFNYVVGQAPDFRNEDGSMISGEAWADLTNSIDACMFENTTDIREEYEGVVDGTIDVEDGFVPGYVDGEDGLMFDLTDVKPKDEGEATISLHTCGNPAYLFARARVVDQSEGGVVEPEMNITNAAGDEFMDTDDASELANYIYTRIWDDVNCNNLPDGGKVDITVVFDESCSMEYADPFSSCNPGDNTLIPGKIQAAQDGAKELYQTLLDNGADAQIAFVSYSGQANTDNLYQMAPVSSDNQSAFETAVDNTDPSGGTDISDGIRAGKNLVLGDGAEPTVNGISGAGNGARADAEKIIVLLSDGFPNDSSYTGTSNPTGTAFTGDANSAAARAAIQAAQDARAAGITMYTLTYQLDSFPIPELVNLMGTGQGTVSGPFGFDTPPGEGFATISSTALVANIDNTGALDTPSDTAIVDAFEEIALTIAGGDDFLYQGSLAGLVAATGEGLNLRTARTEVDGEEGEPQCFPGGVYCYAFDWYFVCEDEDFELVSDVEGAATIGEELDAAGLPRDPNVAQTDSIQFALDFAAVQCRHNMEPSSPFAMTDGGEDSEEESA